MPTSAAKAPCGIIFQNISLLEFSVCEFCLKDSFIQTTSQEKVNYKSKSVNTQGPITAYSLLFWTITWKCLLLITFHSWLKKDKNFRCAIFSHYFFFIGSKSSMIWNIKHFEAFISTFSLSLWKSPKLNDKFTASFFLSGNIIPFFVGLSTSNVNLCLIYVVQGKCHYCCTLQFTFQILHQILFIVICYILEHL